MEIVFFCAKFIFFISIFRSIIGNFTYVPVTLERKPILNLDDWEDALDEQITKYSSVFEVKYDQEYVVKVMKLLLKNVNILFSLEILKQN